jgi:pyridoxal phosphate enzyme (YggS family)
VILESASGAGPGATPPPVAADVAGRLDDARRRIEAAGGDPRRVRIVAVTKGFGPAAVRAAVEAGAVELGENYAQELATKAVEAPPGVRWHFLGAPQRNKIARLAPLVDLWQAIDRAAALDRLAEVRPGAAVLVQVNATGAGAKAGCAPEDAPAVVEHGRGLGLDVQGLMCVGPAGDRSGAAAAFGRVAGLARSLGLRELSMGMSDDFDLAVAEGSTMVRLGRILFGPRPGRTVVRR